MESFRKAYGALKDSTKVGLAKVNSEFKDLDIAIVKATNHVEYPPKERHIRKILLATTYARPRSDIAYCIHALSKRLTKTRNWIVAIKTLIVIHRTLREGDASFREELLNYSNRGYIFQLSNFKDDSSPLAWDCSAWVRTYGLFLEERLECFRVIKYDIESERVSKTQLGTSKVPSRTRLLNCEELLDQLPALQQLLYRLISCRPEGGACHNFLVQYALALVLKESFKIYCAINDGIINLVDMFFDMSKHDAVKALNIYQKAGRQAENLADFYDICRGLDLARTFQFPILRQPPPSFLATMEEYIREAPHIGSISNRMLEYQETDQEVHKFKEQPVEEERQEEEKEEEEEEPEKEEEKVNETEEPQSVDTVEEDPKPALISQEEEPTDLLGLNEVNPKAMELDESNALALAIPKPGSDPLSTNKSLTEISNTSGWELALVSAPSNNNNSSHSMDGKMAGGFNKLLLDSLYEDDTARRQIQFQNAGYNAGYGYNMPIVHNNPFNQIDPFAMSNGIPPPTNVQMALMSQQQQQQQHPYASQYHQQQHHSYEQQHHLYTSPHHHQQQQMPFSGTTNNPFGDPFNHPQSSMPSQENNTLI